MHRRRELPNREVPEVDITYSPMLRQDVGGEQALESVRLEQQDKGGFPMPCFQLTKGYCVFEEHCGTVAGAKSLLWWCTGQARTYCGSLGDDVEIEKALSSSTPHLPLPFPLYICRTPSTCPSPNSPCQCLFDELDSWTGACQIAACSLVSPLSEVAVAASPPRLHTANDASGTESAVAGRPPPGFTLRCTSRRFPVLPAVPARPMHRVAGCATACLVPPAACRPLRIP